MNNSHASTRDGLVLAADDGPAFWFLDTLTLTKVSGGDTGGGFTVLDHRCPPGFAPPPHIHRDCDEACWCFYPEACRTVSECPSSARAALC